MTIFEMTKLRSNNITHLLVLPPAGDLWRWKSESLERALRLVKESVCNGP